MVAKTKAVDLEGLEVDVRAGILSYEQMAEKYGVSKGRISQLKAEHGWVRDLSAKIKAKAEAKLNAHALNGKLNAKRKISEEAMVEAGSDLQASIQLGHRTDIGVLKKAVVEMAAELSALSNKELQDALEMILDEKTDKGSQAYIASLNKAFDAALSLGGRSSTVKNLVGSLGILIDKERQAFGIDKDTGNHQSVGEFLASL